MPLPHDKLTWSKKLHSFSVGIIYKVILLHHDKLTLGKKLSQFCVDNLVKNTHSLLNYK